jgi:hypothetical protein
VLQTTSRALGPPRPSAYAFAGEGGSAVGGRLFAHPFRPPTKDGGPPAFVRMRGRGHRGVGSREDAPPSFPASRPRPTHRPPDDGRNRPRGPGARSCSHLRLALDQRSNNRPGCLVRAGHVAAASVVRPKGAAPPWLLRSTDAAAPNAWNAAVRAGAWWVPRPLERHIAERLGASIRATDTCYELAVVAPRRSRQHAPEAATLDGRGTTGAGLSSGGIARYGRDARLGLIVLLALRHPAGNPLPVTCDGNLLRAHRLRIRFVDIPAGALYVVGLRRPVGQVTRWPISMFGHPACSSR